MDSMISRASAFMSALGRQIGAPQRDRLQETLREIHAETVGDARALIAEILSPAGKAALKAETDRVHFHITGHLSADDIAAITANSIAKVAGIPDWEPLQTSVPFPLPNIV